MNPSEIFLIIESDARKVFDPYDAVMKRVVTARYDEQAANEEAQRLDALNEKLVAMSDKLSEAMRIWYGASPFVEADPKPVREPDQYAKYQRELREWNEKMRRAQDEYRERIKVAKEAIAAELTNDEEIRKMIVAMSYDYRMKYEVVSMEIC